jgi:formylglycine-generating enzyme required for sulfatase activity
MRYTAQEALEHRGGDIRSQVERLGSATRDFSARERTNPRRGFRLVRTVHPQP